MRKLLSGHYSVDKDPGSKYLDLDVQYLSILHPITFSSFGNAYNALKTSNQEPESRARRWCSLLSLDEGYSCAAAALPGVVQMADLNITFRLVFLNIFSYFLVYSWPIKQLYVFIWLQSFGIFSTSANITQISPPLLYARLRNNRLYTIWSAR